MSSKKGGFSELFFTTIMPKVYGIGAAIVIVGALFKIQHYEGAGLMLGIGLGTEAVIFFLSAFEPKHSEPDWTKVYPELSEDYDGPVAAPRISNKKSESGALANMDKEFSKKIDGNLIDSLGKGMKNLADSASKMSNLADAAVATNDYAKNVKAASHSLTEMNKSYSTTVSAMSDMANASKDAKEYHAQVQNVTKNLGALNAVYEMELQDANSHLKAMNKFYSNLTAAMENMAQVQEDSKSVTDGMRAFAQNLTSLNNIYGSMLTAMKGGGSQPQG
ncbi:MAG: gliding motility protein GldL [Bacteroidota bacterium]